MSAAARPKPAGDQEAVLDRVDRAGAAFRGMSAHLRRLSHTAVINEDNVDSGTILLKRAHRRDLRMLIDLTEPDPRTVAFQGHTLEIYYPKAATVQEIDVGNGKDRALLEQFFLLGFGTSRAELQASYNLRLMGQDFVLTGNGLLVETDCLAAGECHENQCAGGGQDKRPRANPVDAK